MGSSRRPFKFLILWAISYYSPTNAICYWPNGEATPQDIACRDDSGDSACCSPGFACLDNGLCMTTSHVKLDPSNITYLRGSCTDQTWKSSRCPNYCVNGDEPHRDFMDGLQGLFKCNNTVGAPQYYCVDSLGGNCTAQENLIAIFPGDPVSTLTTIGWAGTTTMTSTSESVSTSYLSSRSMSTTTSMSAATPNSQTSASSSATITASKQNPSPETVGLGAGLGIPLGLIVLGLAGWLLFKRRKRGTKAGQANRISELPVEEVMHEVHQPKQWRREELSGDSWAPSEMPADP